MPAVSYPRALPPTLCLIPRYRQSHQDSDSQSSHVRMAKLDKYHGQASGIFGCDEHLAGTMPSRGSELCTVVETMFSYEVLFGIQGDTVFGEVASCSAAFIQDLQYSNSCDCLQYL